jgi:hypothetical protein
MRTALTRLIVGLLFVCSAGLQGRERKSQTRGMTATQGSTEHQGNNTLGEAGCDLLRPPCLHYRLGQSDIHLIREHLGTGDRPPSGARKIRTLGFGAPGAFHKEVQRKKSTRHFPRDETVSESSMPRQLSGLS